MQSVQAQAALRPGLIPVVKGNGYGFGRRTLMPIAAELATQVAVGTVYEAGDVPSNRSAMVLTPHLDALPADLAPTASLTVGAVEHVQALVDQGWRGDVVLKLQSSMHRYGVTPGELGVLASTVDAAGCTPIAYALHLPLSGTAQAHADEVEAWLTSLDPALPVVLSHLDTDTYLQITRRHPERTLRIRCGTALWHADRSLMQLTADVLDVHAVKAGQTAGYRDTSITADGWVVLVAAGSAHGVGPLDDGRSPFHFARQRLLLLEPVHMHTAMLFVPAEQVCPRIGDRVDVQRPLILTHVDELDWVR